MDLKDPRPHTHSAASNTTHNFLRARVCVAVTVQVQSENKMFSRRLVWMERGSALASVTPRRKRFLGTKLLCLSG